MAQELVAHVSIFGPYFKGDKTKILLTELQRVCLISPLGLLVETPSILHCHRGPALWPLLPRSTLLSFSADHPQHLPRPPHQT